MVAKVRENNRMIVPAYGLSTEDLRGSVDLLSHYLADLHVLYMKMRKFHWNMTGRRFLALHELFEEQYTALQTVIDETAERIRQYGAAAPGTLQEMLELTDIPERPGENPNTRGMVEELAANHEQIIRELREKAETAVETCNDVAVEDYFIGMMQEHQQMDWMLRAHLEGEDAL